MSQPVEHANMQSTLNCMLTYLGRASAMYAHDNQGSLTLWGVLNRFADDGSQVIGSDESFVIIHPCGVINLDTVNWLIYHEDEGSEAFFDGRVAHMSNLIDKTRFYTDELEAFSEIEGG